MKKNILAFITMCFGIAANAQNGAYIEYKISSNKGARGGVKIMFSEFGSVSDFNMNIPEMPGGGFSQKNLTQKSNPEVVYKIDDKTKTYSESKKGAGNDDSRTYVVTKIGEETVGSYKCIHAKVTSGNDSHEIWNTKDIADYNKYSEEFKNYKRLGSAKIEQALKDAGCDGMPVKSFHKGNEKEGDMTMELVKIEKRNFPKSDFDIPAGYTKTEPGIASPATGGTQIKNQQEIMNMTPEERLKYIEDMKKQYGK